MLVDELGPRVYLDLSGLTVPALVIGSSKDRLLPVCRARKLADAVPNLIEFVEMPGGHCAMLEFPPTSMDTCAAWLTPSPRRGPSAHD